MTRRPIYLDYNATTPCDERVVEAMLPFFTGQFGNAGSADHWFGWQAKEAVDEARAELAALLGARPGQIVFTSGATEAINLALKGMAETAGISRTHIVTSMAEHSAVLDTCSYLEQNGARITRLNVDSSGSPDLEELKRVVSADTTCVALMYANNETGVISPVREISAIAKAKGVPFFCDATQAVGKIPVDVEKDGIDLLACSSHKIYGPKGVGALYTRQKKSLVPQQHGGKQESGLRSGTLNVPAVVGFGKAAELCRKELREEASALERRRDKFEQMLLESIPEVKVNGAGRRLPHVTNMLVPHRDTEQLLLSLSSFLALSRGSACSGLLRQPSHVLKAMGLTDEDAARALRISIGRFTSDDEITKAALLLTQTLKNQPVAAY